MLPMDQAANRLSSATRLSWGPKFLQLCVGRLLEMFLAGDLVRQFGRYALASLHVGGDLIINRLPYYGGLTDITNAPPYDREHDVWQIAANQIYSRNTGLIEALWMQQGAGRHLARNI